MLRWYYNGKARRFSRIDTNLKVFIDPHLKTLFEELLKK